MTDVIEREVSGASDPSAVPVRRPKRRIGVPIVLQIAAMIGIGALLYSSAADWFATLGHNSEISGYLDSVDRVPTAKREAIIEAAREYNAHMPQGVLRDPYLNLSDDEVGSAYNSYSELLRINESGVIGDVSYPLLGISLPVYSGTADSVISKGAGHLYGSSLPIGGPSTHSVLTAHSGLVRASLFTPLPKARMGDRFEVTVLGETHYYEVDRIETVLPEQTEGLRIVNGEDYVTLFTCTPTGINSHRMLVRGVRVAAPEAGFSRQALAGDGITVGIPWWAIGFIGGSAVIAYLLFAAPHVRRSTASAADDTQSGEVCA